ncbi:MAG TPA: LLM class flavin-dependent oxidoreductase [Methylomirabilota bacterium]|jgi:luciferase family oxidoreductase group 1|nr:LLM class flavin-dependent oxidoreductase [Methylomirabilota bacterium]
MRLSVLDQSPVRSGGTAADAVHETLDLARAADRLGYHRYWLAEHHSTAGLAGSSPEVLIARVAALTQGIRVGSGGVMLTHYSALKVAENFRVLETLFPGRIDLGIGRAPGSDPLTARALRHGPGALGLEQFPNQIADLIDFLNGGLAPGHPFAGVRAMPAGPTVPELWLLGSSGDSAAYAAHFGTAFSFAHFINDDGGADVVRAYREHFRPSASLETPLASVTVFALCADTEAEADRLARSRDLFVVGLRTGRAGPYPSVEEAERYPYSPHELAIVRHTRRRTITGAPEQVRERLLALAREYGVEELVIVTITHSPKARLRSYERLAEVFGLEPREGEPA